MVAGLKLRAGPEVRLELDLDLGLGLGLGMVGTGCRTGAEGATRAETGAEGC